MPNTDIVTERTFHGWLDLTVEHLADQIAERDEIVYALAHDLAEQRMFVRSLLDLASRLQRQVGQRDELISRLREALRAAAPRRKAAAAA